VNPGQINGSNYDARNTHGNAVPTCDLLHSEAELDEIQLIIIALAGLSYVIRLEASNQFCVTCGQKLKSN
jgi:hypothetical protein